MEILWEKDMHGRCRPERGRQGRDPERSTNRLKALCLTHNAKPALNRGEVTIIPPKPSEFLLHPQAEPKVFRKFKYRSLKKEKVTGKKKCSHVWYPFDQSTAKHRRHPSVGAPELQMDILHSCPHLWPRPQTVTKILQEAEPWGSPNELR